MGQLSMRADDLLIERWDGSARTLSSPRDQISSLQRAVEDLVNCIGDGGHRRTTGEDALAALEIVIGFHISDRSDGQRVPLPFRGEDRQFEVLIG
jgi:predicted RNase H-like HicB family nuclease